MVILNKIIKISNVDEAENLMNEIYESSSITRNEILKLATKTTGVDFLHELKFLKSGKDPLENRPLNFIEQLNQTFTYMTSLIAVKYLIEKYPQYTPYTLNLGTASGYDITSNNQEIVAETFAVTNAKSNDKIKKDVIRMSTVHDAILRFVFYYSQEDFSGLQSLKDKYPNVQIIPITFKY